MSRGLTVASRRVGERRLAALAPAAAVAAALACWSPNIGAVQSTDPLTANLAEFWVEPEPGRDLLNGVGGPALAPDPSARYSIIELKEGGFSQGYTVRDPQGREWSVKFYPEAHTEVAASRLLWALGYHQPPVYFLSDWRVTNPPRDYPTGTGRFREKHPRFHGLDEDGNWSYYDNPFKGTHQMRALLALQVMLGNSDLKDEQNMIYTLDEPVEGAKKWYVARDLGQTFGRTGLKNPPRDDPEVFDRTPFILGVEHGFVRFEYQGRHRILLENITPADVRWLCERMNRLTDDQWTAIFRAAGYSKPIMDRYIRRLKVKIAQGLALQE
jgi:hypothetical protein